MSQIMEKLEKKGGICQVTYENIERCFICDRFFPPKYPFVKLSYVCENCVVVKGKVLCQDCKKRWPETAKY